MYPQSLQSIIELFEMLPDQERRETLISYADQARKWEPREGESFDLEDIRKDEECADTVGGFLRVARDGIPALRLPLGLQVRRLTRPISARQRRRRVHRPGQDTHG